MRIAIIHGQFVEMGGAERSLLALSRELKKRGYQVSIQTEFTEPYTRKDSLLTPLRFFRLMDKLSKRDDDLWLLSVHGAFISCPIIWAALFVARLKKIPMVVYVYEEAIRVDKFTPKFLKWLSMPFIAADSFIFRVLHPRRVIAISNLAAKNVKNRYHVEVSGVIWPCFQY
jgi:hypothetical protein